MSRGSQHSRMTVGRPVEAGRSSNMKCIVTVGIILPLLAAIIGVAAWTLSSDSALKREQARPFYSGGGHSSYRSRDKIFEERNDDDVPFGQKLPIGAAVSKDILGSEVVEERDVLASAPTEQPEQDPLYVVHYVPQEPSEPTPKAIKQAPEADMLAKILSSGNVKKGKGTPQFVVFAPSLAKEDENEEDETPRHSPKKPRRRKKPRKQMTEYDDDEYTDHTEIKQQVAVPRPRHGDYGSSSEFNGYHHQVQSPPHQQHHQPQPCCQGPMMPPATEPPKGITIQMGSGLPASPLGLLRQLLRPKVDLRKKLFFGIQLENGMGFGGDNPAPTMMPANPPMMGHGGQQQQGHGGGNQQGMMYNFG